MKSDARHIPIQDLKQRLNDTNAAIEIGAVYRHYRAGDFRVCGFVILESDEQVAVRYAKVEEPAVEFVRALSSWLETVEINGKTVSRFTKII